MSPPGAIGPRTAIEKLVADVWCELLGLDTVDVTDDFFALGGHSMLAVQVVYRLEQETGLELELESFFDLSTIENVADELDRLRGAGSPGPDAALVEGEL